MRVAPEMLLRVLGLYEQGLYLQAYAVAQTLGSPKHWAGTEGRLLAGRLVANLGADRLGMVLHCLAWRADPGNLAAMNYYVHALQNWRGPLAAWRFTVTRPDLVDGPAREQAEWLATRGRLAAQLRDFERAEELLKRALNLTPQWAWIWVEHSTALVFEDRYEEAAESARHALALWPWYRPAVQALAHALDLLDRDEEALNLLKQASLLIESGAVVSQLAALELELRHYEDARRDYDRVEGLFPLKEKHLLKWLRACQSDVAYYCGDVAAAARLAGEADMPFHKEMAQKLTSPEAGRRKLLEVPFVRQHHMTCAPATLSAISRYWGKPAEHLGIAEAICYDGTPAHSERQWAERSGYEAREFRVTWESAVTLIDRGIPFTLTTATPDSAHLQACIGYDSRRGTLLIRDPYARNFGEFLAEPFFESYRSIGPRGMVLVPAERAELLEGIELPDAALYDRYYQVMRALDQHDRTGAVAAADALAAEAAGHRLTLWAKRAIASYDADSTAQLACIDSLLGLYANDAVLQLAKLGLLRTLIRRDERLEMLERICAQKDAHPLFWLEYVTELAPDARQQARAWWLVRRCLRHRPVDARVCHALAGLLWDRHRREEAADVYRVASCLNDKDEQLAMSYFIASRHLKRSGEALRLLRDRFDRFGKRSGQPARTLFRAQSLLDQPEQGFETLDAAVRLRPEDGDLLLYAADARARFGHFEQAQSLLDPARGKSHRAAYLRTAAAIASYRGGLHEALALWQEVLQAEPLAADAHGQVTQLLAETAGRAAALEHLRQAAQRFPFFYPLHRLREQWLSASDPAEAEAVARHLIALDPADAWAHRELALLVSRQGRPEEALAAVQEAIRMSPQETYGHSVRARVLAAAGRTAEAAEAARAAIRLSVDNDVAITELMETCDGAAQRREALAFIHAELVRQVIFGDALPAYRRFADLTYDGEEVVAALKEALNARPDLWQAWSALLRQYLTMNRLGEAMELAQQAATRFPLLPVIWLDLSVVQQFSGDVAGEIHSLEQALAINPGYGIAVRRLAAAHQRQGDPAKARAVLEKGIAFAPLEAENHASLADILWRLGEREAAIERIGHALRLYPDLDWPWDALVEWGRQLKRPAVAVELARDVTVRRGGESRSWILLARTLQGENVLEEQLEALDRAIALDPRCIEAHDLRATLLAQAKRFDEAKAACRPAAFGDTPPIPLRGRAAWVFAEQGQLSEAIEALQPLVAEDPSYYWAWQQLANWHNQTNNGEEYLRVAKQLVRLAPHDAIAHGCLGEAFEAVHEVTEAKAEYRRSIELKPTYEFGAYRLFDLQLEDEQWEEAAGTLARLQTHMANAHTAVRAVELAVRNGSKAKRMEAMAQLWAVADDDPQPLRAALEIVRRDRYLLDAEQSMDEALRSPGVNPHVARLWGELLAELKLDNALEAAVRRLVGPTIDSDRAAVQIRSGILAGYIEELGRRRRRWRLWRCVRRHAPLLRSNTETWGAVGFAWANLRSNRRVTEWMSDWSTRADAKPAMLNNLAYGLRAMGRDGEATAVSLAALAKPPDHATDRHAVWVAFEESLQGQERQAADRLQRLRRDQLGSVLEAMLKLSEAMLMVQQAPPVERKAAFAKARRRINAALAVPLFLEERSIVYRSARRVLRRVARDCGTRWARFWCGMKRFRLATGL